MADLKYIATLVQSSTTAPVATELKNTFGGVFTYARSSSGVYTGTRTGELDPVARTTITITPSTNVTSIVVTDVNKFTITMTGDGTLAGHRVELNLYSATAPVEATDAAIITLEEVKDYLKIPDANTDEDDFLQLAINDATNSIENYIANKVVVQTITDEVGDGDGTSRFYTEYYPIIGLGAVGADSAAQLAALRTRDDVDDAFAAVETDINHIILDTRKAYIQLYDDVFPLGRQTVKITYRAGYATIPNDLKEACMILVVGRYKASRRGDDRFGKDSESNNGTVGSMSTRYLDLPKAVKELLSSYRKFN